jgi:hypothetical protein
VCHGEDRLAVRYKFHVCKLAVHITGAAKIIPCAANPLNGQTIVKKALDDAQSDEVAKTVDAATSGPAVCRLK